jgi:uncharacterized membrane protein
MKTWEEQAEKYKQQPPKPKSAPPTATLRTKPKQSTLGIVVGTVFAVGAIALVLWMTREAPEERALRLEQEAFQLEQETQHARYLEWKRTELPAIQRENDRKAADARKKLQEIPKTGYYDEVYEDAMLLKKALQ